MVNQMRQIMYHKASDMLRKAKLLKNGSCETILESWYTDADYQKSLSDERLDRRENQTKRRTCHGRPFL